MQFAIKRLGLSTGTINVVVLREDDAFKLGVRPGDRVRVFRLTRKNALIEPGKIAVVDIALDSIIAHGEAGLYHETVNKMDLTEKDTEITLFKSSRPPSFQYIKQKILGQKLSTHEIQEIIKDVTDERLLPIELGAFITAVQIQGLTDNEIVDFTHALANSGDILDLGPDVFDKHSTGGVPGNKVSLIIVPILAAARICIPKTSTRAITSPSGTADSMEVLAPVTFSKDEMMAILNETHAGIFWPGLMRSAPASNILINISKSLDTDPLSLMVASILSKKLAVGVKKLVLDVPCGRGTKFSTPQEGEIFAVRFKHIAARVGIETVCLLTSADQPIGHAVGPALEAREALRLLQHTELGPSSLLHKATDLAGVLLELAGKTPEGHGKDLAIQILFSGQAYEKMRDIIKIQGGNQDIMPEDIEVGPLSAEIRAEKSGIVSGIRNQHINQIAKLAGCPGIKTAGVEIIHKIGAQLKVGDVIMKIYAKTEESLQKAIEYANGHPVQELASMTIARI
ncbi:MAG: thymidine phosphorylase [Promethearchaeota archaeon]